MHTYVFTLEYSLKGPVTDWLIDASALVGQNPESYEQACAVANLLEPGSGEAMRSTLNGLKQIGLRARFTALGRAFILRTESAMDREAVDTYVQRMAQLGQLDQLEKF